MGEWNQITLGNACSKIGSGATPRGGKEAYRGGDTVLIRSQNIYNDRFTHEGLAYIDDLQANELRNVVVEEGDVLLNITGDSVARCCQVDSKILPARVNQHVAIIRPQRDTLDARFLRYSLINPPMQSRLLALASAGATRNALTKAMIESLTIEAPFLEEQRAIAHILGTLDDKIELNRRMNETLEAMARALFKSWFVDFEPVRAKAEGRDTGLPKEIADVFPDSFEDSELGEVPKGWKLSSFADTVEIIGGGTPKTSVAEYWDGNIPWFSVVDAPNETDVFVIDTQKKITQAGLEGSSTRLLPEGSTIISARGTVGKVALVGVSMTMNQSCYGLRSLDNSHYFAYFSTRTLIDTLQQRSHGSVFDTITRDTLTGITTVVPPGPIKRGFELKVAPMMQRIKSNLIESSILTTQRDTLLPKLLNGEISVYIGAHDK